MVHTWDGRRLIVPINYFLEKPFENWIRVSPEVIGKVKIYTDYSLPVHKLRDEFNTWLEESTFWDKRSKGLLVTAATDTTIEIRTTMSAKNAGDAWDLECMIREKLIRYIHENYPECLPLTRIGVNNANRGQ